MITKEQIMQALATVIDPEIGYDIVRIGLVYDARITAEDSVEVDVTLTSPTCPLAETILEDVSRAVKGIPGVTDAKVNIVWEPPYSLKLMDPDLRAELFPMYNQDEEELTAELNH